MGHPEEQSLVERETGIGGFRVLMDTGTLGGLLGTRLADDAIRNLRVNYLRYKPGINCIARFEYTQEGSKHWGYAKAFGANAGIKLRKAAGRPVSDGPLGPGRLILPDEGLLVCFLPNDSRLKSLYRLAGGEARDDLLERVFKDDAGWRGADFTALNYKPERRFVARFTSRSGKQALIKIYTEREFKHIRKYRKRLRQPEGVVMPAWIGGSKAHCALAFSWLPGDALEAPAASADPGVLEAAGEAVARFHKSPQPGLKRIKLKYVKPRLDGLAEELGLLLPGLSARARGLARTLCDWRLSQDSAPLDPIHGDFYHRQIVVHEKRIALIDSDDTHLGLPLIDIGNFAAHLERAAIGGDLPSTAVAPALDALCSGYRRVRANARLEGLGQAAAYRLFHLLHDPFRERADGWPEQTAVLLQRCADLFEA